MSGRAADGAKGWWRLTASVFAVVGATIAFGYYLPLRQANQLLAREFGTTRQAQSELTRELGKNKAELAAVTSERDELRDAKTKSEDAAREAASRVQRVVDGMPASVQTAVKLGRLKLTAKADAVEVDVSERTWITAGSDGLTRTGHQALCPVVSDASRRGSTVTVRAFVSPAPGSGESRWAAPGRLAAGVAETLVERCKLDPTSVSVASSSAGGEPPVLRLELSVPKP